MAERVASTAEKEGAEVRLRHVARDRARRRSIEAPGRVAGAPRRGRGTSRSREPEDLAWADVVMFGSPTRYGHVASQLQAFLDTLGPLWQEGKLADKVYTAFTVDARPSTAARRPRDQALHTTFTHFGGIIVPPGYTDPVEVRGRQPVRRLARSPASPRELGTTTWRPLDHLVMRALEVGAQARRLTP